MPQDLDELAEKKHSLRRARGDWNDRAAAADLGADWA